MSTSAVQEQPSRQGLEAEALEQLRASAVKSGIEPSKENLERAARCLRPVNELMPFDFFNTPALLEFNLASEFQRLERDTLRRAIQTVALFLAGGLLLAGVWAVS